MKHTQNTQQTKDDKLRTKLKKLFKDMPNTATENKKQQQPQLNGAVNGQKKSQHKAQNKQNDKKSNVPKINATNKHQSVNSKEAPQQKKNPDGATKMTKKRRVAGTEIKTPQKKKPKIETDQVISLFTDIETEASSSTNSYASESDDLAMRDAMRHGDNSDDYSYNDDDYNSECDEEDFDFDSEEEEEEEDHYLNYDEEEQYDYDNDYSSEYSMESNNPYSFGSSSDDEDYHLPHGTLEDLIIHQGTAEKRSLRPDDNVHFESDNDEAQIIELPGQSVVKCVQQPKAYAREELLKLNELEVIIKHCLKIDETIVSKDMLKTAQTDIEVLSTNGSECPQLVPIVDEDGFETYNSKMDQISNDDFSSLGSDYVIVDSDDSIVSIDVNSKYMQSVESSSDDCDEVARCKLPKMKAEVIVVDNTYDCVAKPATKTDVISLDDEENSPTIVMNEELTSERVVKHVNLALESSVVSTTILESEHDSKVEEVTLSGICNFVTEPTSPAAPTVSERSAQNSRSIFCNAVDSNDVLVLLKDPLYIYGTVKLTTLTGTVTVYGHTPKSGIELEIFSPRGCSVVQVAPTSKASTKVQITEELQRLEDCFTRADLQKISENYTPHSTDALLLLKRNTERKQLINMFKKYMNENVFPNMNALQTERPNYASEYLLRCIINSDSERALKLPTQWLELQLLPQTRMLLAGGKSVGKSTLLRTLINHNLAQYARILLIDLDIGQPELFVPQTISCTVVSQPLLGPGFFLNHQPDKAYTIGQSNIMLCAHEYMRAVKQLLLHCQTNAEYAEMPWLINTMGYNRGFGLELIAVLTELLQPTDVVQLQSNKDINNFETLLQPSILPTVPRTIYADAEFKTTVPALRYRLHVFNSAVLQRSRFQREWEMSAKDMRYAMILARLSYALQGNAEWLTDVKPYSAALAELQIVNLLSEEHTREELLQSIDANLVYLCRAEGVHNGTTALECLGIGIVRGIDYNVQQVFLIPAMPQIQLRSVNCLALGEMPLPTSLFTNQGPKVKNIAPYVYNTIDDNASKSIKQIYYRPAEFLQGKHKELLH